MSHACATRGLALVGLLTLSLPATPADPPPIPFDARKAQVRQDEYRAWYLDKTLGSYKKVGRRNPKWDALVEEALKINVDRATGSVWTQAEAEARFTEAIQAAVKAGCDDPLIGYFAVRFPIRDTDATTRREYHAAARALAASKYPDLQKAHAWLNAIAELQFVPPKRVPAFADLKAARAGLDELLKLLAVVARDRNANVRKEVFQLCQLVHRNGKDVGERKEWFDQLDEVVLSKLPGDDPLPHLAAGAFLVEYAWDARGSGVASTVTEEGFQQFKERLTEAERRLTRAWDVDHECAEAAARMVTVCIGLGHDREKMETWFRRTLEADPGNTDVFDRKASYLQPKWHGEPGDALAFARQALKLERWDTGLPLLVTQAHYELGASSGNFVGYFRDSPEAWNEIEPILAEIRKRYPKSPLGASYYLYYAWVSNRNREQALEYTRAVSLELRRGRFRNQAEMDAAKSWASGEAKKD